MNVDSFIDTNVLVYAATRDPESRGKRERALRLIEEQNFALSAQVLQEFYVTVTRKIGTPLPPQQALAGKPVRNAGSVWACPRPHGPKPWRRRWPHCATLAPDP